MSQIKIFKNMMSKTRIKIFLTFCFLTVPLFISEVLAQPDPPHPGGPNSVPINGLAILAAIGIGFGVRKLWEKNKLK